MHHFRTMTPELCESGEPNHEPNEPKSMARTVLSIIVLFTLLLSLDSFLSAGDLHPSVIRAVLHFYYPLLGALYHFFLPCLKKLYTIMVQMLDINSKKLPLISERVIVFIGMFKLLELLGYVVCFLDWDLPHYFYAMTNNLLNYFLWEIINIDDKIGFPILLILLVSQHCAYQFDLPQLGDPLFIGLFIISSMLIIPKMLPIFSKIKGKISEFLESLRGKNREGKPLADSDSTNNRSYQSILLFSNSRETSAREGSKGACIVEGVLSSVNSTARISSRNANAKCLRETFFIVLIHIFLVLSLLFPPSYSDIEEYNLEDMEEYNLEEDLEGYLPTFLGVVQSSFQGLFVLLFFRVSRTAYSNWKTIMVPKLKKIAIYLEKKGIISDFLKFVKKKNREEKALVDFYCAKNKACQSRLVSSNSERTNARGATQEACMREGVLSLVDSVTRISSTDFHAPENRAVLVRACPSSPDSSEQKPSVAFDAINDRACKSDVLVSDLEQKNMQEASRRWCMPESVLSLVDLATRVSTPHFDALDNSAHFVRVYQIGPIVSKVEKKDMGEGLNRECLAKRVLTLADSGKQKPLQDVDATKNKAHLVRAYQRGPVVCLSENTKWGDTLKRECITKNILGLEYSQRHTGGRRDDAGKSFDSILVKSLEVVETPPTWEQPKDSAYLLSPERLTLEGGVEEEKSPNLPGVMLIDSVEQRATKFPGYLGGLIAQCASSSGWSIGLRDGTHIVLLDPSEQCTENETHAAKADLCSPNVSLPEKKNVRMTLKRKCRTMSVTFEIHQEHFGRRCEGAVKTFCVTRISRKHQISIHKQHKIRQWPCHQKLATRKGYSIGDEIPLEVSNKSMNENLDSQLQFVHMSQFARSSHRPLGLRGGGEIVEPGALSSSQFATANNRAGLLGQDQSGSIALYYERKCTRETLTMSLLSVEDLQQYFGCKHKDAMKRRGVNVSMCKSTCRQHQVYRWPCQNRNNDSLVQKSFEVLDILTLWEPSKNIRQLVPQGRLALRHCIKRKKSHNLPRTWKMNCSGGLTAQYASSLHWLVGIPDGGNIGSVSERINVRKTYKRKCQNMSVSFENSQKQFKSRCEGDPDSVGGYLLDEAKDETLFPVPFGNWVVEIQCNLFCLMRNMEVYKSKGDTTGKWVYWLYEPPGTDKILIYDLDLKIIPSKFKARDTLLSTGGRSSIMIKDFDFEKSAMGLPDGGHILSLSERIMRKASKRKCRSMSVLSFEDHKRHVDSKWEDAAKSHGAKRIYRQLVIHRLSTAKGIHKQHGIQRWPFSAIGLPDGGHFLLLTKKKIDRKALKKCRSMSALSLVDHQLHVDRRWADAESNIGAKRVCRQLVPHRESIAKCICRQHGIYRRWLFQQDWATMKGHSLGEERPVEVTSLSTCTKHVSRLELINISWLGRFSLQPSALAGGGKIGRPIGLSLSESAATKNIAQRGGHDQIGSAASDSENERTQEQEDPEEIYTSFTSDSLRRFSRRMSRKEAAARFGVSLSTFKRKCRACGIERWPHARKRKVKRPPDQHGQGSTSTACLTPAYNVQTMMQDELAGQNQEGNQFRDDLVELLVNLNRESGLVIGSRLANQHGESKTSTACEMPSHNAQTGIEGVLIGRNKELNECQRDLVAHGIALNLENGLTIGGFSEGACQVNDQLNMPTPHPNHGALSLQQHQIESIMGDSMGGSVSWTDSLASQGESILGYHASGANKLTFSTCSIQAAPSQPVASTLHTMSTIRQMMSHLMVGSSETFQPEGQSMPNQNAPTSPQPQTTSTQIVSENMWGSLAWTNPGASQEGPYLDRHISRSSDLAFPTCYDQAAPSQYVEVQSMQSTIYPDHNALVFPQTQRISPQEPFPNGQVFESINCNEHTNNDALVLPQTQIALMSSQKRGDRIDRRSSSASQAEPFPEHWNLTLPPHSDRATPSQHVEGQSMQPTVYPDHIAHVPQPQNSIASINWNEHTNHDALVFPQTQITSMLSRNRGDAVDRRNSLASQVGPFSNRQIPGSSNLTLPTYFDQAAPSQQVEGQSMQPAVYPDHSAFVPQTQNSIQSINCNVHIKFVKIKAFCGDTILKFLFPLASGIANLKQALSKRLNVEVDRFEVKYKDDDEDLILIPCNEDWELYLSSMLVNKEIRVFVLDKVGGNLNFCESCRSLMQRRA